MREEGRKRLLILVLSDRSLPLLANEEYDFISLSLGSCDDI